MPLFQYKAKKGTETVTGRIEARNQTEAVEMINKQGLVPVTVEEWRRNFAGGPSVRLVSRRVTGGDLFVFSRQLANLIKAGIPLLRAIDIVREQTQHDNFRDIVTSIHQKIKDGESFSESLSQYPKVFSSLYVAMIHAGEEGGNLKEMLLRLSDYQKRQQELLSKVRNALAYPILMGIVGIATVFFILTFVMPRITDLFTNTGEQLPIPTQIVMSISSFLQAGWWGVLIAVLIFIIILNRWSKTGQGRTVFGNLILRMPLFGQLVLKTELTRFARTLELLLNSGIPLQRSLNVAVPILGNERIKKDLSVCQRDLEVGSTLGNSLRQSSLIPAMMANLISIGEESGSLEESLCDIADGYEQETNELIKTMTSLLEPVMILLVGLVVGFIVISMLLPIFQMDILAR